MGRLRVFEYSPVGSFERVALLIRGEPPAVLGAGCRHPDTGASLEGWARVPSAPAVQLRLAGAGVHGSHADLHRPGMPHGRAAAVIEEARGRAVAAEGSRAAASARLTAATDALVLGRERALAGAVPGLTGAGLAAAELESTRRLTAWESGGGLGEPPASVLPKAVVGALGLAAEAEAFRAHGSDVVDVFDELNVEAGQMAAAEVDVV